MNTIKIGWIGLGNMGIPMATQLLKAGYRVTVYNRSANKEETLAALGATAALTPANVATQADLIFIMVADDAAVREIFTANNGLLTSNASNRIIVNMSTVSPGISREFANICSGRGWDYLDAPVSGSVKQAQEGQLVIMAAGSKKTFAVVKPALEHLGKLVMHIGAAGAGNTAKLAINSFLAIQAQGLAETVTFAEQNGIVPTDLLTLINNSALGSTFVKIKGDAILANNYTAAFALKHIVKDLALAKDEGLALPLGAAAFESFTKAKAQWAEEDIIAIIKQFSDR